MQENIPRRFRSFRLAASTLCLLGTVCALEGSAQVRPRWRSHDLERPHPPIVRPAAQALPVAPPSDAVVLFDGSDLARWRSRDGRDHGWKLEGGELIAGGRGEDIYTVQSFGDVQLHLEWAAPLPARGEGQGRGNSGVFFMELYEVQILDSYENETYADGQAAAIYGQFPPLVNACRPPGEWQSYDVFFRRPRFRPSGELERPARMTVFHNGVLVQDAVDLVGGTMWLQPQPYVFHPDRLPLSIQDHGNPVKFRNIWLRELRETERPGPAAREAPPQVTLSPEQLERCVGLYKHRPDAESAYEVKSDGRQLHCLFGRTRARVDFAANSERRFSMRWTDAHVEFELGEEGPAPSMTLTVAGSSFTVKRIE